MQTAVRAALLLSLLGLCVSQRCRTVSCRDLPTNVCATVVSDAELSLSTPGCQDAYICNAKGLFAWLSRLDTVAGSQYGCTLDNTGMTLSKLMSMEWPCYERVPNRNFMNNATALACQKDEDCALTDGTVIPGSCACGLRASDSLGICQPDFSSDVFQGYWDECDNSDNKIDDPVTGYYWYLLMHYYPLTLFDVPCAKTLYEVKDFYTFKAEYDLAGALALSLALLVN